MGQYQTKAAKVLPTNMSFETDQPSKTNTNTGSSLIAKEEKVPGIVFTRYLYIKDEVKLSLLISLLKKSDESAFWAYELYYSGFERELFEFLWKIYFDFYYTLNPSFYAYFAKKYKTWLDDPKNTSRIVFLIVSDLMIRPFNLDVFLLRQTVDHFIIDNPVLKVKTDLCKVLNKRDYISIFNYVLHICKQDEIDTAIKYIQEYFLFQFKNVDFQKQYSKVSRHNWISDRLLICSTILLCYSMIDDLKMGKKLYLSVEPDEILTYQTVSPLNMVNYRPYKVLPEVCCYSIDGHNYLSLFKLNRSYYNANQENIQRIYLHHWEYYASFSPVWLERIQKFGGKINHDTKKVDFSDDDLLEQFYEEFGYEPDEQKKSVQEKSIQPIQKEKSWLLFYETFQKNGLYKPDMDKMAELDIIEY